MDDEKLKKDIQIETVISRLIELYNKAKKDGKDNPVQWATYKTSEWVRAKHPGIKVKHKPSMADAGQTEWDDDFDFVT